ncbi:hypothetical protein H2200_005982 [Cladophialophora chaetospira]|uniref:Uncharacterized protein n=1 Tax=Cladophialophora chaetospira TaxID=386627 RepID=A0AA38XA31_9EURO|nr:hypothetical protein H2200_005982 [Cladophialophora chaetospira]
MSAATSLPPRGKNPLNRRWLAAAFIIASCALMLLIYQLYFHEPRQSLAFPISHSPTGSSKDLRLLEFPKPHLQDGVKIIGLVFFGRKDRVEILRCYLERNLVDNGGWLDEIHFVKNTKNKQDLKYLGELLASSARYKAIGLNDSSFAYRQAWTKIERGQIYVKIDDDVVWFEDETIPRIVSMKLAHPEYWLVSANMINSPLMGWVHYHLGAVHPYLPELTDYKPGFFDKSKPRRKPWSYREYPAWTGPGNYSFGLQKEPPYDGHRWLRLPNESDLYRTPIWEIEYHPFGTGLKSWAIAAQQHYSFLENLADNKLDVYRMGAETVDHPASKPWFTDGRRLSINFIAIWSDDVLDNLPMDDVDEEWLTMILPKRLHRQVAVNTDALAVHFSFGTQPGVEKTDLLARYRDYALSESWGRRI